MPHLPWLAALKACKMLGFLAIVATGLSGAYGTGDAGKDECNAVLREQTLAAHLPLWDIASDPRVGADGASSGGSTACSGGPVYQPDDTHPTLLSDLHGIELVGTCKPPAVCSTEADQLRYLHDVGYRGAPDSESGEWVTNSHSSRLHRFNGAELYVHKPADGGSKYCVSSAFKQQRTDQWFRIASNLQRSECYTRCFEPGRYDCRVLLAE